jgi:hypothetical protein
MADPSGGGLVSDEIRELLENEQDAEYEEVSSVCCGDCDARRPGRDTIDRLDSMDSIDSPHKCQPNQRTPQEIARNPYSLKAWLRYLEAKTQARPVKRYLIYERALKFLPGSYKLWHAYLQERRQAVEGKVVVTHARYQILVNTYER